MKYSEYPLMCIFYIYIKINVQLIIFNILKMKIFLLV